MNFNLNYSITALLLAMPLLVLTSAINDIYGSEGDRERWDTIYDTYEYIHGKDPNDFLRSSINLVPRGRVLVLAMGEGRNAVFLAEQGFYVEACDISPVAVKNAARLASERGVNIKAFEADLEEYELKQGKYDLITNFYYLQRNLIPQIYAALKPGGMAIMETYTVDNLKLKVKGPRKREHLLEENELLRLFMDVGMKVIYYREMEVEGRAIASIIAQRPE